MAGLDSLPAGAVGLPTISRVDADQKESELGRRDWRVEWPVSLAFDLSDSTYTIGQAREVVEAFIKAIDADDTLGGIVDDAKVTRSEPVVVPERPRPMVIYDCTVSVLDLV